MGVVLCVLMLFKAKASSFNNILALCMKWKAQYELLSFTEFFDFINKVCL